MVVQGPDFEVTIKERTFRDALVRLIGAYKIDKQVGTSADMLAGMLMNQLTMSRMMLDEGYQMARAELDTEDDTAS